MTDKITKKQVDEAFQKGVALERKRMLKEFIDWLGNVESVYAKEACVRKYGELKEKFEEQEE